MTVGLRWDYGDSALISRLRDYGDSALISITVTILGSNIVSASQVAAPGVVSLSGASVTIQNATDTADSTTLSKSSSFGVTLSASSVVTDAIQTTARLAAIGSSTSNARVAAVSAVAGGLAIKNGVDAAKDVVGSLTDNKPGANS